MNNRFMRMMIFFDLPTTSVKAQVEYRKFRKFLIKTGFIMLQESIYTKLVINRNSLALVKNKVCSNLPTTGNVQLLTLTENQFANIELLRGTTQNKTVNSTERIVFL